MAFVEVFGRDPLELWLLGGLAAVTLAVLARTLWRKHTMRAREGAVEPFLVFPEGMVRRPMNPGPTGGLAWAPPASDQDDEDEAFRPTAHPADSPPPVAPPTTNSRPQTAVPASRSAAWTAPPAPRPAWSSRTDRAPAPAVDEASETIRLPTAADGTVQILPGMLVMTQGPEVGREYRFLRIGAQPVPEVTIGRASGPPYRHIHLPAATVSRMHARIRYEAGEWRIANLSTTNPLCINGRELPAMQDAQLADGDRIQIGEVELSYRDGRS